MTVHDIHELDVHDIPWHSMTFHDIPWHSITPVRITYNYPGKRPQTVWGSGRTMYDAAADDDDDI